MDGEKHAFLKTWFASRRSRCVLVALGVLLVLPSISNRLVLDDYLQALNRISKPVIAGVSYRWWDLFSFGRPGALNDGFIERGILLPWWTHPEYKVAFFRPLSALTHVIDGWLWSSSPALAHVQSIAWYAILLALVAQLYARLIEPAWLAGFALLLFVFDDAHGETVNWIANRHAIVATVFGVAVLWAHDGNRRAPNHAHAWIGPTCFGLGLLAGETVIASIGYLFAYAWILDRASNRSRALSLLPYVVIAVVWRAMYERLGYGAFGTDGYIDPGREPGAFLARFPQTIAVLLQAQLGSLPSDLSVWYSPETGRIVLASALLFFVVIAWLMLPLLRQSPLARFWCLAMVLSIIPSTAAPTGDRTLLFSSVAAAALFAQLFATTLEPSSTPARRGVWRALATVLVIGLLLRKVILGPCLLPIRSYTINFIGELSELADAAVPNAPDLAQRSLIIVNPPVIDLGAYLPLIRELRGETVPKRVRWLSTSSSELKLTRTSQRSVLVRSARGFLQDWPDRIFRGARFPLRLGEKVELSDMTATVTALRADAKPSAVEFAFREPLESPLYLWMYWDPHGCHAFSPPRMNRTVTLPAVDVSELAPGKQP